MHDGFSASRLCQRAKAAEQSLLDSASIRDSVSNMFLPGPSWSFLVLPGPPWSAFHPSSDSVLCLPLCSMPRPVSIVVDSFAQTPNCIYSSYISSLVSLLSLLSAEAKRHRLWSVHPVRSALEHCSALIAPGRLCRGLQKHLVSHLVRFLSHPGLVL